MTEQTTIAHRPTFEQWLAGADLDALIDGAIAAAEAKRDEGGIVTAADDHLGTYVWIPLGHERSKPLVQHLAARGIGRENVRRGAERDTVAGAYAWEIPLKDVIRRHEPELTWAQRHAIMDAFAHALCEPGFVFEFHRV